MCGSSGRFFLYRRESERTLPGGRDRASAGYIRSAYFFFGQRTLPGGLGKPVFYFTGRCSGKSASWKLCGDDRNECFGTAGVYHVSDPDGSRADRKGIRWIDGTWDCGNWSASDKSVAAFTAGFQLSFAAVLGIYLIGSENKKADFQTVSGWR